MDSVALFLEAEALEQNKKVKEERRTLRNKSNVFELSDMAFKKNFRLNKSAFSYVLEEVEDKFRLMHRSDAVTPEQKLAACLRFFAEGSYQHGAGKDYQVAIAQSTFSNILKESLDILEETLCPKWISLKMSDIEIEQSKTHFFESTGFPGVIGCIDGTHVQIISPIENKHLFLNRKGHFSLNVMIICDFKMQIKAVNPNYQGSNHDSHVWNLSPQRRHFEQNYLNGATDSWLLGDSGYGLEPWLMTPFRTPMPGSAQSRYNKSHRSARNIVERTIGLAKSRFRCLLGARQLHYSPKKTAQIVNVCCALHNICLHFDREYNRDYLTSDWEEDDEEADVLDQMSPLVQRNRAAEIRNEIVTQHF